MRIYVAATPDGFVACASEIPGSGFTGHEVRPTRDEAIQRASAFARAEISAYERLGTPLAVPVDEQVVEWTSPLWLIPEYLVPLRPSELKAAVARMDDLGREVERVVSSLSRTEIDRRVPPDWSVGATLDHMPHGLGLGPMQLAPLPLDPVGAQTAAMRELADALRPLVGGAPATTHFGTNVEGGRVRWTPRKVVRSVRTLQAAWSRFASDGGTPPRPPFGHDDRPEDDIPLTEADIVEIEEGDRTLHPATARDAAVSRVALWYRYYRSRLVRLPDDERSRWRAMCASFRAFLLSADETDLALVRLAPFGIPATIRSELRLGIGHVVGHLDQIRALTRAAAL